MVTTMSMDPAGSRIVTGGMDDTVYMWDWAGMAKGTRPFRNFMPEEGNPVVALGYSTTGDRIIACTSASCPRVFDREGELLQKFVRGDPYLMDMKNTKGHVSAVTGGQWHPTERDHVMTSGQDGTVRIWDLNGPQTFDTLINKQVVRVKNRRNLKTAVTSFAVSNDASVIVAGTSEGSVQFFSTRSRFSRPDPALHTAHGATSAVTGVALSPDGRRLASRSEDDTLKVWDLRMLSKPLLSYADLPCLHVNTDVAWSPDGKTVATGTSVRPVRKLTQGAQLRRQRHLNTGDDGREDDDTAAEGGGGGEEESGCVVVCEGEGVTDRAARGEPVLRLPIAPGASVVALRWHARINHIVCGTSGGEVVALYDPTISCKGALLGSGREMQARRHGSHGFTLADADISSSSSSIHNPNALPMYRDNDPNMTIGRKRRADRKDPVKSKKPELPADGDRSADGRATSRSSFTQFYMQSHIYENIRKQDPREELLKYKDAKKDESSDFVGRAYTKNQPGQPILAQKTMEASMEAGSDNEEDE